MVVESQQINRFCVILPTYNNALTLAQVLRQVLALIPSVIIVNDGSTDETAKILRQFPTVDVVTHKHNLGKGAALLTGFFRATESGFTHAVTLDTDGQHFPSDLTKLIYAAEQHPDTLIVGDRLFSHPLLSLRSRLLRTNSNFWVWVETGSWVRDTQCGFRCYPLSSINSLLLKTRKYDFEIESLVKLVWAGTPILSVPIGVTGDNGQSHFRPLIDFALVTHLNGCLLAQRMFLPAPLRKTLHLKTSQRTSRIHTILKGFKNTFTQQKKPEVFAASLGIGIFLGILPIWGFQIAVAFLLSHRLRLITPITVTASNISFPAAIPFILFASLVTGRFALTGHLDCSIPIVNLNRASVWNYTLEYLTGAVILALLAGLAATILSYVLIRTFFQFEGRTQR